VPLQFFECAIVRALGGIDPALQAVEGVDAALEDMTEGVVFIDTAGLVLGCVGLESPELGSDAAQAAELPIGVHERIDQETSEGSGGLELQGIAGSKQAPTCSCVCEWLGLAPATVSHHLRELESAGLVNVQRDGKFAYISLRRDLLDAYVNRLSSL
jgi:ArsR family transcriptional regulator